MNQKIPRQLEKKVQHELNPGERIVWQAMPRPHFFSPGSIGAFLFAIPWTAFAIFWMFGASQQSGSWAFTSFGIPFVLIGLGMLCSPLWTYRKSQNSVYVITDERAITFEGAVTMTIRSYEPERLKNLYRKERRNGTGDVIISRNEWKDSEGSTQKEELGFLRIEDPKMVESILKELAKG